MRRIGAIVAMSALAAALSAPAPSAAFTLRFGPFYFHFPFYYRPWYWHWHRHHVAHHPADQTASLAGAGNPGTAPPPGPTPALLYPSLALPAVYDEVFWPSASSPWPFSYRSIFQTAFAKSDLSQMANACQQPDRRGDLIERIQGATDPTGDRVQQLQKLGDALDTASSSLAKACPTEIPPLPVPRLQFIAGRIETLGQALEVIRQPLQDFEQSLDDPQRARFAALSPLGRGHTNIANARVAACGTTPTTVDWSIERLSLSLQPTDAQREAMASLKQAFGTAANGLDASCPLATPPSPLARLKAIEARLDATWRAVVAIQVALADFDNGLNDEQRARLDSTDFAAAQ